MTGVRTRTCALGSGWSGAVPSCVAGKVGDSCAIDTAACDNLTNAECTGGTCACLAGFNQSTEYECTEINECASSPCMNEGNCTDKIAQFSCTCPKGYNGSTCETNPNNCDPQPCQNGGSCVDGLATYTCNCVPGYTGDHCATNINECAFSPCLNGGTCVDGVNKFKCVCVPGYTGDLCGTDIDECSGVACANGGTCVDGVNLYTCLCALGYGGALCKTNVNECSRATCQNGGTCVDGLNSYTCLCERGFDGRHCENVCPVLDTIPHGRVDMSWGRGIGAIATYTCDTHYALVGESVKTCEANGNWRGSTPECVYAFVPGILWVCLAVLGLLVLIASVVGVYRNRGKICGRQNRIPVAKDRRYSKGDKQTLYDDVTPDSSEQGPPIAPRLKLKAGDQILQVQHSSKGSFQKGYDDVTIEKDHGPIVMESDDDQMEENKF